MDHAGRIPSPRLPTTTPGRSAHYSHRHTTLTTPVVNTCTAQPLQTRLPACPVRPHAGAPPDVPSLLKSFPIENTAFPTRGTHGSFWQVLCLGGWGEAPVRRCGLAFDCPYPTPAPKPPTPQSECPFPKITGLPRSLALGRLEPGYKGEGAQRGLLAPRPPGNLKSIRGN